MEHADLARLHVAQAVVHAQLAHIQIQEHAQDVVREVVLPVLLILVICVLMGIILIVQAVHHARLDAELVLMPLHVSLAVMDILGKFYRLGMMYHRLLLLLLVLPVMIIVKVAALILINVNLVKINSD
jgi:hypothetical protein